MEAEARSSGLTNHLHQDITWLQLWDELRCLIMLTFYLDDSYGPKNIKNRAYNSTSDCKCLSELHHSNNKHTAGAFLV